MKLLGLALLMAALGLGAAGCGGDDAETISKEDFLTQANQICREAQDATDAAFEEQFPGEPSDAEIETFWNETARPNVENQVEEIRALGAPEGDEEQIDELLAAVEDGLEGTQEAVDAGTVGEGPDPFAEADRLSADYGLTDCGDF
jgi:hypothetical protein